MASMTFPRDHLESPGQRIRMTSPADNLFNVRDCRSKYFFCFSLPFSIFFVTPSIRVGFSCFLATARRVRVRLPNSNWAGEAPMPSVGVLRHSSMLRSGSCLSSRAFFTNNLQVFTAFSTFPLLCGW